MLVQKEYVLLILVRGYRTAELRVKMLKDNIELDIKIMESMTVWIEICSTYIYIYNLQITIISHDIR